MAHPMFVKHQDLLGSAVHAIESRGCWRPFAEDVAAYGEGAVEQGRDAFEAYPDAQFYLDQPGVVGRGGGEVSPWGFPLNVSYPKCSADALIAAGKAAMPAWVKAGPDVRAGVCAEILDRLNAHSMEIAHAVMHTTGQSFSAAFLEGCPRAQARALEAVALAWREMKLVPYRATWEKPQGGALPLRIEKRYQTVARGVALNIAGAVAPTWSSYPGLFASLATGNAVVVKPHSGAILPLAITVAVARQTLKEAGFDSDLVSLLVDTAAAPIARDAALKPDVRLIDYTGNAEFGNWLEENARQADVFTAKSGINSVVVDGAADYEGMLKSLALALAANAGQTCMTPRVLFVAEAGVQKAHGVASPEQFCRDLANAIGHLLKDSDAAFELLGAIQSPLTIARLMGAEALGEVVRESAKLVHSQWPQAEVRTPMLLKSSAADAMAWSEERFGPLAFVVETGTTAESLAIAERLMREQGALNFAVFSTNDNIVQLAEEAALRAAVSLSINLVGAAGAGAPAAFSDYHASGANAAGTASMVDGAYVCRRFHVVQSYRAG